MDANFMREIRAKRKISGDLPVVRLSPYAKALANPKSLRKCITGFCYECMGGDGEPGARNHVKNCTAPKCPLWHVRPWQERQNGG